MSMTVKMFKAVVVSLAIMGASMQADAFDGKAGWKEEVLLHDGTKLIVDRFQIYGGYAEPASRERSLVEEQWMFQIPGSGEKVVWKSDFRRPPDGDSLMLLQLNFINRVPYIATTPAGCLAYNHWGRPNPPYIFFKYDGKSWQRISANEFPVLFKESNVVIGRPDQNHRTGLLTVEMIKEENHLLEPHLKRIVREPITGGPTACEKQVHYKCGWFGTRPDGTLNKEFADRMCDR